MFKKVDVAAYALGLIDSGVKPNFYTKTVRVKARKGTVGDILVTRMKSGLVETVNTVKHDGDFILTNPSGEEYIIPKATFEAKYNPVPNEQSEYSPKPSPQLFLRINESISFTAPWGEAMNIAAGGFLNVTDIKKKDVYGIQKEEFLETYSLCDPQGKVVDKPFHEGR